MLPVLREVNGTPYFSKVLRGRFNQIGRWRVVTTIPPGLSGLVAQFQCGTVIGSDLAHSNRWILLLR